MYCINLLLPLTLLGVYFRRTWGGGSVLPQAAGKTSLDCKSPTLPCSPQAIFRMLPDPHVLTTISNKTNGPTSFNFNLPGPQNSSCLMDTEAPCASTLLPKILCLFTPAWLSRLPPRTCFHLPYPFSAPGFSLGMGRGLQFSDARSVPLTFPEKQIPQRPHSHTSARQTNSLDNPNPEHPRSSGCTEGAVVLLESPMFRRRNLDSEQDAPKVKISRGKWKLVSDLAGLFQEPILVSQPLSNAYG